MRVSVVIPTLDEADRIGDLITGLRADGFEEIIVADGASGDETKSRAAAAGARVVDAPRGRGQQLQHGALAASGDILFFLHADSAPPPGSRAIIASTLARPGVAAGCFRLAFDQRHPFLAFYALMSRVNHSLFTYGDQGLFLSRATFDCIGGYSDLPLFEDVEILQRARRAGRFIKRGEPIITSARRFRRAGIVWQEIKSIALLALYRLGVSPQLLVRWYRSEKAFRE